MILKANLKDDILTSVYINTDKKEIHTMDGKDIPFSKVCHVKEKTKNNVFSAANEINVDDMEAFTPGGVYEFYEFSKLVWRIYYPVSFEDDSKGLFKYAGINLYEGIARILQLDIDEDKKYILCKDFIDKLDKLADIYENTAYQVYMRDGKARIAKAEESVDKEMENLNKARENKQALENRTFAQKLFNITNIER